MERLFSVEEKWHIPFSLPSPKVFHVIFQQILRISNWNGSKLLKRTEYRAFLLLGKICVVDACTSIILIGNFNKLTSASSSKLQKLRRNNLISKNRGRSDSGSHLTDRSVVQWVKKLEHRKKLPEHADDDFVRLSTNSEFEIILPLSCNAPFVFIHPPRM